MSFLLVSVRWLGWLLVGHPIAVVLAVGMTVGGALRPDRPGVGILLLAIAADALITGVGKRLRGRRDSPGGGRPASLVRRLWIWQRACRFRRRWPSTYLELGAATRRAAPIVLPGNYYSAPGGFRPVMTSPQLSAVPRRLSASSVEWSLRPRNGESFDQLGDRVARLTAVDRQVQAAELVRTRSTHSPWILTVAFTPPEPEDLDGPPASPVVDTIGTGPPTGPGSNGDAPTGSDHRPRATDANGHPADGGLRRRTANDSLRDEHHGF